MTLRQLLCALCGHGEIRETVHYFSARREVRCTRCGRVWADA